MLCQFKPRRTRARLIAEANEAEEADENEADEPSLTLAQVPAAVATTIRAQAGSAAIKCIELEDENGTKQYSVEVAAGASTREFKVATDGRFLGNEPAEENDNDNVEHEDNRQ